MPKDDPGSDLRAAAPYRPALAETPEALGDKRLEEAMQSVLAMAHSHNAQVSIKEPDERGAFLPPMDEPGAWAPEGSRLSSSTRTHCEAT